MWDIETAEPARAHDDATVMALGARQHGAVEALALVRVLFGTPFSGETRHTRRIGARTRYRTGLTRLNG